MGWEATTTAGFEMPPIGTYIAKCVDISEPFVSELYPDKEQVRLSFEIKKVVFSNDEDAEEYVGETVPGYANFAWGPKAKLRGWTEALLGRKLDDNVKIRSSDLIGKLAVIAIDLNKGNPPKPKVEKVQPYTAKKNGKKQDPEPEPELELEDLDLEDEVPDDELF